MSVSRLECANMVCATISRAAFSASVTQAMFSRLTGPLVLTLMSVYAPLISVTMALVSIPWDLTSVSVIMALKLALIEIALVSIENYC